MYSNSSFGNIPDDLRRQRRSATHKRLEASPASEIVKWAIGSLKGYNTKLNALDEETKALSEESKATQIELKRLKGMAPPEVSGKVSQLRDMHRKFMASNGELHRKIEKCRQSVKEAVTNYQLTVKLVRSPLADQGKKISAQSNLKANLDKLEKQFSECAKAVAKQKRFSKDISQTVHKMLSKIKESLPSYERERMDREDKVSRISLDYKKSEPSLIAKNVSSKATLGSSPAVALPSLAAIALGIYIGTRLFKK